jgi:SsrA-binding protein
MSKTILKNKKANFDYFIEETFKAGLVLQGWMVKAILAGRCSLDGVYLKPVGEEVFTVGLNIIPQENAKVDVSRGTDVKLLLKKNEIAKIIGAVAQKGYSLIPVDLEYLGSRGIKMNIALAKGKKQYDKRETIKQRDIARLDRI